MTHYDVIAVGDAKLDTFLTIAQDNGKTRLNPQTLELCFKHGEKISVEHTYFSMGGNAANVVVGLTRLGVVSAIAAEVGDDEFSLKIMNTLAKEHVDRAFVHQAHNQESSMSVIINFKNDRTIFSEHVHRTHNFHYQDAQSDWLYVTSLGDEWVAPYERALRYCDEHKSKLVFNPGTLQLAKKSRVVDDAIRNSSLLFINKEEAKQLLSEYGNVKNFSGTIQQLLEYTLSLGPKIVVVTDGKNGSYAMSQEKTFYHQENFPAKIIERTGAGDAYASGFLGATILGKSIKEAMLWGSINAAGVIEQLGAEAGLVRKEAMEKKVHGYK